MAPETPILRCALHYAEKLGWCIIPIPHGQKIPRRGFGWKRFQTERPDREQLQKWFGRGQHNIAVIVGAVSGGLTCRDFDRAESYAAWAKAHPDLAKLLPTVKTSKGYHVYFLASVEGAPELGDGELRGSRCYCMLPPSVHPDGPTYKWIIRPTAENLLIVDPEQAGFVPKSGLVTEQTENTEKPEQTEHTEQTEAIEGGEDVERIIGETLPREFGTRNRKVFELARTLKSLPQFAGAEAQDLRAIVQEWHRRALPKIRTREFEETWIDFLKAWPRVRHVKGTEPMTQVFQRAVEGERPQVAVMKYPENQRLQILVSLCRELQRAAGAQPLYLSCRAAGRLFSVSHTEAARWLFLLESDGILQVVTKGGTHENPRNATRFRYLGD
jgi:hypothetical protein